MKLDAHRAALELLERHPGWSDRRIARELRVSHQTVGRWRWQAGYMPATKKAGDSRRKATAAERLAAVLDFRTTQRARAREGS